MDDHPQSPSVQVAWAPYELLAVVTHLVLEDSNLPRETIIHAVNEAATLCPVRDGLSQLLDVARQRALTVQNRPQRRKT